MTPLVTSSQRNSIVRMGNNIDDQRQKVQPRVYVEIRDAATGQSMMYDQCGYEKHTPTARKPSTTAAQFPRQMRRGSTGYVHRMKNQFESDDKTAKPAPQNDDFLKFKEPVLQRSDSIRLLQKYKDEDEQKKTESEQDNPATDAPTPAPVPRIYRRKPRRMSGCAVDGASLETIKNTMPCLLQRENSVHLIQKRLPSRRASMNF